MVSEQNIHVRDSGSILAGVALFLQIRYNFLFFHYYYFSARFARTYPMFLHLFLYIYFYSTVGNNYEDEKGGLVFHYERLIGRTLG